MINQVLCCIFCLLENPIIGGIIAGFITTLIIWLYRIFVKQSKYYNLYSKYEGNYKQYKKRISNDKDYSTTEVEKQIDATFKITRKGYKFIVNGETADNNEKFYGEITMDERMPLYGRGYYKHEDLPKFGFYEVQMNSKKEEFYVHRIYFSNDKDFKTGYVWEKIKE